MGFMDNAKSVIAGSLAVEGSELIFYKLFPRVPFLNDKTMLSRAIIAGGATLLMGKSTGVTREALLCVAAHNVSGAAHTIERYHDFLGISDNTIDSVASEAVASIEQSITDELAKLKEGIKGPLSAPVSGPMSSPVSKGGPDYEEAEFIYS